MLIEFGHLSDLMVEMRLSLGHRHKLNEEGYTQEYLFDYFLVKMNVFDGRWEWNKAAGIKN